MRRIMFALVVVILFAGAAYALREPIGCFLYLRSSQEEQIAYMKEDGVYVMEADGSNQCKILEDNFYLEIAWSPDGEQLAIFNLDGNLYTARPNGSELREIASSTYTEDRQRPAWSPDSTRIAYVRNGDDAGLYLVDVASGSESQIVEGLPALFPVWSPEGDWIAFATVESELYVVRADGSDLRQLASEADYGGKQPVWLADGQRIAYINSLGEISLIDLDDSNETVLTDFEALDHSQAFYISASPSGEQIAADVIVTPFALNLFVIDVSTGEARNLTPGNVDSTYAAWTPDGEGLIYGHYSPPQGDGMLSRVNVSTDEIVPLAPGYEAVPRPS